MKFTGILVPFLAACAQASLPYNLQDADSQQEGVAEFRHHSKSHPGKHHGHHGATGTGGLPHYTHHPAGTGSILSLIDFVATRQETDSLGTGSHRPHHTKPAGGMLPGQHGSFAESDNGEPKAWGGEHHWGSYPPYGKGKGKGKGRGKNHGTGVMSFQPYPRPTGTGGQHYPGHGGLPPTWPKTTKTTLSTKTRSATHSQSGSASRPYVAQQTQPAQTGEDVQDEQDE
ncbi:uncharacterized protein PG998_002281 [Apiospora kogelbergensis]|uniref:Uncharacterized protein n=1 Tax=Apiospora kogelbergensis TaxID=1337665 RepID=A0AAW0Q6Q2_9PEZI